jgi:hypothetical protein
MMGRAARPGAKRGGGVLHATLLGSWGAGVPCGRTNGRADELMCVHATNLGAYGSICLVGSIGASILGAGLGAGDSRGLLYTAWQAHERRRAAAKLGVGSGLDAARQAEHLSAQALIACRRNDRDRATT